MCNIKDTDEFKFSVLAIIFLSLFPGVIMLLLALFFSSPNIGINLPFILSILLAILFGLIPIELGIMKYFAWKNNKKIRDLILYKEKTSLKNILLSIIIPLTIAILIFIFFPEIEGKLWKNTFSFFPDWAKESDRFNFGETKYLTLILILNFILNGFFGPLVEELYFRGFLLPRMKMFGRLSPLVNVILFSVYHFFTPWENITRILAITPLAYSVWINKNVKIGIIIHCSLNTLACIGALAVLFV